MSVHDQELDQLLAQARAAQARMDFSKQEFGFETRLGARLGHGSGPGVLVLLWRAVGGCAAAAGLIGLLFILSQAPQETEDALTAFWDCGQTSYDLEFLN